MAMTYAQIRKMTPMSRIKHSKLVAVRASKVRKTPDDVPLYLAKTQSTQKSSDGKLLNDKKQPIYLTTIEVLPKKVVIVSCSCEDWMYTWEMACAKRGAARQEYSNGEKPVDKNPAMIPGACKHIICFGDWLIGQGLL